MTVIYFLFGMYATGAFATEMKILEFGTRQSCVVAMKSLTEHGPFKWARCVPKVYLDDQKTPIINWK